MPTATSTAELERLIAEADLRLPARMWATAPDLTVPLLDLAAMARRTVR